MLLLLMLPALLVGAGRRMDISALDNMSTFTPLTKFIEYIDRDDNLDTEQATDKGKFRYNSKKKG